MLNLRGMPLLSGPLAVDSKGSVRQFHRNDCVNYGAKEPLVTRSGTSSRNIISIEHLHDWTRRFDGLRENHRVVSNGSMTLNRIVSLIIRLKISRFAA